MGKVTDVSWEPATEVVELNETGEFVMADVPGKYDYKITVTGTPKNNLKTFISFGDQPVRVGEHLTFKSTKYTGDGYIIDMIAKAKVKEKGE